MTVTAGRPGDWIFNEFPDTPTDRQLKYWRNIFWRVAVMWIPPRDPRFDMWRDMGSGQIEAVLHNEPLKMAVTTEDGGQHIMFLFPERHLTTQEEQQFPVCLYRHHQIVDAPLTVIDLVTKSALIVGGFLSDDVLVIKDTEDFETGISNAQREAKFAERKFGDLKGE
jgi:hypothetical protein